MFNFRFIEFALGKNDTETIRILIRTNWKEGSKLNYATSFRKQVVIPAIRDMNIDSQTRKNNGVNSHDECQDQGYSVYQEDWANFLDIFKIKVANYQENFREEIRDIIFYICAHGLKVYTTNHYIA